MFWNLVRYEFKNVNKWYLARYEGDYEERGTK